MNKTIEPTRRRFTVYSDVLGLSRIGSIAAAVFVLQPTIAMAQGPDYGGALIDTASDPSAYFPRLHRQPLLPSDVAHVLRDWGLQLLSMPTRSPTSYEAIVRDDAGQDLFVPVDPYDGRILNLDLVDRVLSHGVVSQRNANERLGDESSGHLAKISKPATSLSPGYRKRRVAIGNAFPRTTTRVPARRTISRVEHDDIAAASRDAATQRLRHVESSSTGVKQPRNDTALGEATTPTRANVPDASAPLSKTSPGAATSAPSAPSTIPQKIDEQHAKIPAVAGFD